MHDLEVLDRGLSDPTFKIEHVDAPLVAPHWGFVSQQDQPLDGSILEATQ